MSWATVCTDKRKGGLGIKNLSKMNKALLCKWSWRFANDRDSLRRKIICNKFGEDNGGWHISDLRGSYETSLWKEIRKEWPSFFQNAAFSVGDGRRINFWKDVWRSKEAMCSIHPSLFNLDLNKEATVADMWDSDRGEGCWSPTFLRSLNDWEIEVVERFLQTLCDQNFSPSGEDMSFLKGVKEKWFSVKIMYKILDPSLAIEFPSRSVWNPVVPPKIGFFAWEVVWGKVLMLDQLKRRGMTFANRFFLCEEDEESIDHLLIHCKSAKMLWNLFLLIVRVSWVFSRSILHTLLAWQGVTVGKKHKKLWMAAPLCCFRLSGVQEVGWCSRMRPPLFKGLKLTLFSICGLGPTCIVLKIRTL